MKRGLTCHTFVQRCGKERKRVPLGHGVSWPLRPLRFSKNLLKSFWVPHFDGELHKNSCCSIVFFSEFIFGWQLTYQQLHRLFGFFGPLPLWFTTGMDHQRELFQICSTICPTHFVLPFFNTPSFFNHVFSFKIHCNHFFKHFLTILLTFFSTAKATILKFPCEFSSTQAQTFFDHGKVGHGVFTRQKLAELKVHLGSKTPRWKQSPGVWSLILSPRSVDAYNKQTQETYFFWLVLD